MGEANTNSQCCFLVCLLTFQAALSADLMIRVRNAPCKESS